MTAQEAVLSLAVLVALWWAYRAARAAIAEDDGLTLPPSWRPTQRRD